MKKDFCQIMTGGRIKAFLTILFVLAVLGIYRNTTFAAGDGYESENNGSKNSANLVEFETTYHGTTSYSDTDYFKYTLDNPGYVCLFCEDKSTYISDGNSIYCELLKQDGLNAYEKNQKKRVYTEYYHLEAGTYYIKISGHWAADVDYEFSIHYVPEGTWLKDYYFDYSEDDVILWGYVGEGGNVVIPAKAILNGRTYNTVIRTKYTRPTVDSEGVVHYYYKYCFFPEDNITSFNTEKGVKLDCGAYLFGRDSKRENLKSIDISNMDTSSTVEMSYMFSRCASLCDLNLTNINTSNVETMDNMFNNCSSLTKLDLRSFNTEKVLNMASMFYGCYNLTDLNISSFDTGNVTNMSSMFYGCESLKEIDVSSFNTSNVEAMAYMFSFVGAESLDLSGFDTSKVDSLRVAFQTCENLKKLDISSWTIAEGTDTYGMFNYCSNINEIKTPKVVSEGIALPNEMYVKNPDGSIGTDGYRDLKDAPANSVLIVKEKTSIDDNNGAGDATDVTENKYIPSDIDKNLTEGHCLMYRLYNPNTGEHFYTGSKREGNKLVDAGWNYEGIAWEGPVKSNTPVYRLYNPNVGEHHYTPSKRERDNLIKIGWNDEGIGWYSDDNKGKPLYRLYNPNATTGNHHYTTSTRERDQLVKIGWNDEGIGWYGYAQ